ncbi:hypothetical protein CDL15_Pgr017979 [Punica granatum]|nr:hypothetical protein CDL15_Pgr017979 [Punica granatum]
MMEDPTNPLAPVKTYHRSDQEFAPSESRSSPWSREHRTSKCCVYILLWAVISAAIALVFALVVFRVETPDFRLSDVTIKNLHYATSPVPSLNATLIANVTVKNTNFGRYKFENGTSVSVLYAGHPVGDRIVINAGRARARDTKEVNVTMEVRSSWLGSDVVSRNLSSDLNSGTLQLSTYAKLRGRVHLMEMFKRRRTAEMNCTITVDLPSEKVQNVRCS